MHEEFKEDVKAMRSDISEIKTNIAVIKSDISHHIKRTDLAELRITRAENWSLGIFAAIAVAIIGGVIKLLIS
jgi:hypothetical protein